MLYNKVIQVHDSMHWFAPVSQIWAYISQIIKNLYWLKLWDSPIPPPQQSFVHSDTAPSKDWEDTSKPTF